MSYEDDIQVKRMYTADERRKLAETGDALADGSFPIVDEEDLKNAISSFGRAKDASAAQEHIIKRATELDLEEMVPEDWGYEDGKKGAQMDVDAENVMDDEDMDSEDEEYPKKLEGKAVVKLGPTGEMMKCAKGMHGSDCGYKAGSKVCGKCGAMAVQTKTDNEGEIEYYDGEVDRLDLDDPEERSALRRLYLEALGTKSADIETGAFVCMTEQKVLDGETAPCADCRGGCIGTKNLPDLAEMEAVSAQLFGTVVDSGYSDAADRFLVTVERKDGLFEVHYSGQGEFQALVRLPEDMIADEPAITADEAIDFALDRIEGKSLGIGAAVIDGYEVYAVEIDGVDGKSYDVFVDPSNGTVLEYDAYEMSADEVDSTFTDPAFTASLMEFQMLEAEQDIPKSETL